MKRSKMYHFTLYNIFLMKQWFIFSFLYSLFILYCLALGAKHSVTDEVGIFDIIVHSSGSFGTLNQLMYIFLAIPLTVTFFVQIMGRNEKGEFAIKYSSRFHMWHIQVGYAFLFAAYFTILSLLLSFGLGALMVGTENTWLHASGSIGATIQNEDAFQSVLPHLTYTNIVFTLIGKMFVGILFLSFCTLFLKQFMKHNILVLIVLLALAGLDRIEYFSYPFFTRAISSNIMSWIKPMTSLYHGIYILVICGILYAITGWLYERKDFLS